MSKEAHKTTQGGSRMRINNNLMAMNTHRQLGINTNMGQKSVEKLSSGFRINRAGDDAAGLAISEKMRGQIRGLNMASKNAQDGISLIQTAEGGLNETHAILQRMRELAVQSANDTNVEVDREEIQKEVDQLAEEITRIAETTEFNTQNLLGGGFDAIFHVGANTGQNVSLSIEAMDATALNVDNTAKPVTSPATGEVGNFIITAEDGTEYTVTITKGESDETETEAIVDKGAKTINVTLAVKDGEGEDYIATNQDVLDALNAHDGIKATLKEEAGAEDEAGEVTNGVELKAETKTVAEGSGAGINVSSQSNADVAVTVINAAIEKVSSERSKLGAMQNRLEYTIKNLDTSAENLRAAESRIRDVDMAAEIMEFTKQNILQQASTAMLAQANMAPQSVLQLLG